MPNETKKAFSDGDPCLRTKEAQQYLSIGRSKFYTLIAEGKLRQGAPLGRARIWRRSWLDAFLASIGAESASTD